MVLTNQFEPIKTLGIFIPVFNEEENLAELFDELQRLRSKLVLLGINLTLLIHDNHSTDNSWNQIKKQIMDFPGSRAIRFKKNIGYQPSLTFAFSLLDSDCMVVYQSDQQDPLLLIIEMVKLWKKGNRCVVAIANNRAENLADKVGRMIFTNIFRSSSDIKNFKWFTDFYLLDRNLYSQFKHLPLQNQFIRGRILDSFNIDHVLYYKRKPRVNGISKFNFRSKYSLALDGILLHATRVFRRLTIFGFCSSILLMLIFLFQAFSFIFGIPIFANGLGSGFSFAVVLSSFSIFLLSLVLEYLRRIYYVLLSDLSPSNSNLEILALEDYKV
jgi:glycosyltransferase involved in cell wall biosynthesis